MCVYAYFKQSIYLCLYVPVQINGLIQISNYSSAFIFLRATNDNEWPHESTTRVCTLSFPAMFRPRFISGRETMTMS